MEALDKKPDIIVIGTGASGLMKVAAGLQQSLKEQGIELIAQPTGEAYKTFNMLVQQNKSAAGCFHLTC